MADAAQYAAVPAEMMPLARAITVPDKLDVEIGPATVLGALGVAGLAAYNSFHEFVKEPRAGKTFWVSAASGGVGQVVGQIAKMYGMKVIGSMCFPHNLLLNLPLYLHVWSSGLLQYVGSQLRR